MAANETVSTKMQIVEYAIQLYKEYGYHNVTVKDICEKCGLTRSAFYYHFKSKEEILDNYFLYSDTIAFEEIIPLISSKNYLDQFYYLFEMYLDRTISAGHNVFGQILIRNINKNSNTFDPEKIAMRNIYISLIKNAQEAGLILNNSPASELADAIVYIADGIAFVWCNKKGEMDIKSEHRRMLDTLLITNPNNK